MSRSWERKVRQNSEKLNKQRMKQGKPTFAAGKPAHEEFKGRSFIMPIALIAFAIMYGLLGGIITDNQYPTLYWITIVCYVGLGIILFLRRPFLRVGAGEVSTIRWNRLRTLSAKDMKKIAIQPGYVVIEHTGKGANWILSRVLNRYDTNAMGERLRSFANQHKIEFEDTSKKDSKK
ncbi:methyltransferase [Paenibacillus alvei]|uniref:Methyltransferase n=1 Tax=Paenibacillus alvei TaxID=44250 RepID=A0ABT4E7T3_PAEAL|nr:methyltransferase [Paenibacillus alvei]MCY9529796.1 methyltransferase [Paenibacillus alvei]